MFGQCDGPALCGSNPAGADQLAAMLGPDSAATGKDPRRPGVRIVSGPAYYGSVAVARQRDGDSLLGVSDRAGAHELTALLGPDSSRVAGEDPGRAGARIIASAGVVVRTADDGGVAVVRQRDRHALLGVSDRAGADQLDALLAPDPVALGEDPGRASARVIVSARVVGGTADDGGVAVARHRDRDALLGVSDRAGADQL